MYSAYLSSLSPHQRESLIKQLFERQSGKCFICQQPIDLKLHSDSIQIDHVVPLKSNGRDHPDNFALCHASCNESKQDNDLQVARALARFEQIRSRSNRDDGGVNLDDILHSFGGSLHRLSARISSDENSLEFSLSEIGDNSIYKVPFFTDQLSDFRYCFTILPIEYLHHDDRINPRSIGKNISKLVKEFYLKRPQLHIPLAWISTNDSEKAEVKVFDGQHKAASQILLGVRRLPVRIFVNPDIDVLLATNTNAGTTLRQIAFDKSVQRHLGSSLYRDRILKYQKDRCLSEEDLRFSEKDLVSHFRGESREIKRYILDNVRDSIRQHPENRLIDFIDFGGRAKEKPLSYSTIEKTFYSFFIYGDVLDTSLDYKIQVEENPRQLEVNQITKLMSIIAEEIFIDRFDFEIGTYRIENRIQKGEDIPDLHLTAYRMAKEEILYSWLIIIRTVMESYYAMMGKVVNKAMIMHYNHPELLWRNIRNFVANLRDLPFWVNRDLSLTLFGGKQVYNFWQKIFESGVTPEGTRILEEGLNFIEMIKDR